MPPHRACAAVTWLALGTVLPSTVPAAPAPGDVVATLPPGSRALRFGTDRFFSHAGVWFHARGRAFVVVAPPYGIVVPALPPGWRTLHRRTGTYYHANGVYYADAVGQPGYVVVAAPAEAQAPAVPASRPPATGPDHGVRSP